MAIHQLTKHIQEKAMGRKRFIVAIAGPPASGKSTLAQKLCAELNGFSIPTKVVPMDGFHLDNRLLDGTGLRTCKGAPQTFDVDGFYHLINRLSENLEDAYIPAFDRKLDLSVACADKVSTSDEVLLVEGNYLLLNSEPWSRLAQFWDLTIFLKPSYDLIESRLIKRWLDLDLSQEEAVSKANRNDLPNAKLILEQSAKAEIEIAQ